ncbi:hypothetical protein [Amycolatopsis sp. YIM 10]|uniref:hypothetical protein n=1 Tax=Amycolatopsis sp. YIM 10 TaxID=2653857 RepID=UPI00129025C1|nr:hypothetical protein [Amycolatopsis sp. YIM 10]QFU87859.1 hypothetical protein YIM_13365 [Amycolatopsis sp. YIM 10]QFU94828.1 hypothetical protein YIM_48515 [Amycolatopsis sp. YIM 10]
MPDPTMPPLPDTRPPSSVRRSVRIHRENDRTALFVDDLNIANTVVDADVSLHPTGPPEVTLRMIPGVIYLDSDLADIGVDDATHAALLKLGWTPPARLARS